MNTTFHFLDWFADLSASYCPCCVHNTLLSHSGLFSFVCQSLILTCICIHTDRHTHLLAHTHTCMHRQTDTHTHRVTRSFVHSEQKAIDIKVVDLKRCPEFWYKTIGCEKNQETFGQNLVYAALSLQVYLSIDFLPSDKSNQLINQSKPSDNAMATLPGMQIGNASEVVLPFSDSTAD